ncbi:MAG: acetyl-CoA carboxylase biotin carboxyl carrier protein subunit [Bdellovibrio sp.]|nr:acetyl-CoA carboxylase biotin carboxyl carrier protein subunit [Bdellovibrio sp.]
MIAYPPAGSSESLKPVRLSFWGKKGRVSLSSGGVLWSGELSQQRQTLSSSGQASSDADLVAQFPGKIRKILVKKGDQVAESDPLILVEAMKMEFAIKAPFNGVVLRLLVEEGQQISPGARFLDLEEKRG